MRNIKVLGVSIALISALLLVPSSPSLASSHKPTLKQIEAAKKVEAAKKKVAEEALQKLLKEIGRASCRERV